MRHRLYKSLGALATGCALIALSLIGQAAAEQGRYRGESYTKAEVANVISRVENNSDAFVRAFDQALDRSRMDGSDREDQMNKQVRQLDQKINALRSEFDRRDTWQETRTNVQAVLQQADEVERMMLNHRLRTNVEQQWRAVRSDLVRLAGIYDMGGNRKGN
jgi:hypothetical protein